MTMNYAYILRGGTPELYREHLTKSGLTGAKYTNELFFLKDFSSGVLSTIPENIFVLVDKGEKLYQISTYISIFKACKKSRIIVVSFSTDKNNGYLEYVTGAGISGVEEIQINLRDPKIIPPIIAPSKTVQQQAFSALHHIDEIEVTARITLWPQQQPSAFNDIKQASRIMESLARS